MIPDVPTDFYRQIPITRSPCFTRVELQAVESVVRITRGCQRRIARRFLLVKSGPLGGRAAERAGAGKEEVFDWHWQAQGLSGTLTSPQLWIACLLPHLNLSFGSKASN